MSALAFLLERESIIALALSGGMIATVGSYMVRRQTKIRPQYAHFVLRLGYGLTFVSVAFFIVAGFATAYSD